MNEHCDPTVEGPMTRIGKAMRARMSGLGMIMMVLAVCTTVRADKPTEADKQALEVAASVQAFYDQVTGVQAEFYQTYFHRLYDRYERSKGKVVFLKPGKMRWDYGQPNGKVIVSDGAKLLVFEPGGAGESPQLFERVMNQESLPAAFSFLTGTGRLEKNFSFRLLDAAKQGYADGAVLELRPLTPSPQYERILFYVFKQAGQSTGVVRRVLIVDASGNRNRFDFSGMVWSPKIPANKFQFTAPAGTRRVTP